MSVEYDKFIESQKKLSFEIIVINVCSLSILAGCSGLFLGINKNRAWCMEMWSPSWHIDLHTYNSNWFLGLLFIIFFSVLMPFFSMAIHVYQLTWCQASQYTVCSRINFSTLRHSNTRHASITVNKLKGNRTDLLWYMVEQEFLKLILWQNTLVQSLHYL